MCASGFPRNFFRQFVVAEIDELRVTKNAAGGPLSELDFGHQFGSEPDVIFHVFSGDAFAPMTGAAAGQIGEGTAGS